MTEESLFDIVMEELLEEALKDGVITEEERAIIDSFRVDLSSYQDILRRAQRDGVISGDEVRQLDTLRLQVSENARKVALSDEVVSDDEQALIRKFFDVMLKNRSREMK